MKLFVNLYLALIAISAIHVQHHANAANALVDPHAMQLVDGNIFADGIGDSGRLEEEDEAKVNLINVGDNSEDLATFSDRADTDLVPARLRPYRRRPWRRLPRRRPGIKFPIRTYILRGKLRNLKH